MTKMIAHIRGQVMQEKAEAEVQIAQRERVIAMLRSRIDEMAAEMERRTGVDQMLSLVADLDLEE